MKYPGLSIDQTLSGEHIVSSILSKCSARLKCIYRHGKSLNEKSRKLLFSALVQCHFGYSASSWYMSLTKKLKQSLQIAQNKMVRFILNLGPRSHVGQEELDRVGILNTKHRVNQLMACCLFNWAARLSGCPTSNSLF